MVLHWDPNLIFRQCRMREWASEDMWWPSNLVNDLHWGLQTTHSVPLVHFSPVTKASFSTPSLDTFILWLSFNKAMASLVTYRVQKVPFECWLWPYMLYMLKIFTGQWRSLLNVFEAAIGIVLKSPVCVGQSSERRSSSIRSYCCLLFASISGFCNITWGQSGLQHGHGCFSSKSVLLEELKTISAETKLSSNVVPSDFSGHFLFWERVPKHLDPPVRMENPVLVFLLCEGDVWSETGTKPSWTSCCWVIKTLFSLPLSLCPHHTSLAWLIMCTSLVIDHAAQYPTGIWR